MSLISGVFYPNLKAQISCSQFGVVFHYVGTKSKALALQVKSRSFCFKNDVAGRYAKQRLSIYKPIQTFLILNFSFLI